MSSDYFDEFYASNKQYFGDHPENMLRDYYSLCDKKSRILDVGIGQGRNARFLLQQGYGVDGIDISQVAIESLTKLINDEHLDLNLFHMDFNSFNSAPKTYSAVLIINLFQYLSIAQVTDLANKAAKWLKRKGIIFISAYTKNETGFKPVSPDWQRLTENSFTDNNNNFRTLLDIEDVMLKFKFFKPIYKWEGYGERHSHGTDNIEQHHMFELILQKL